MEHLSRPFVDAHPYPDCTHHTLAPFHWEPLWWAIDLALRHRVPPGCETRTEGARLLQREQAGSAGAADRDQSEAATSSRRSSRPHQGPSRTRRGELTWGTPGNRASESEIRATAAETNAQPARTVPVTPSFYVRQFPRSARISLWARPARVRAIHNARGEAARSGSTTGCTVTGAPTSPVNPSRPDSGSGASGTRSGAGEGETPHRQRPPLMGQYEPTRHASSDSESSAGDPQQPTSTRGTAHADEPQHSSPPESPTPSRGSPPTRRIKMVRILIMEIRTVPQTRLPDKQQDPGTYSTARNRTRDGPVFPEGPSQR